MPVMVPRRAGAVVWLPAKMDARRLTPDSQRWLACAADMAVAGKAAAAPLYGTAAGRESLGVGAGGDDTLEIDQACEMAIRQVLAEKAPAPYRLVSEEAGIVGPAGAPWTVVVDPVDGSLNAKHGLQPFGGSIAIAQGDTLADLVIGHVEDYVRPQAFAAAKGAGLTPEGDPQRFESDLVEILLLEAGRPDRHRFDYRELSAIAGAGQSRDLRVRQIGSIALSLCYLATGVADTLVAAVGARSVDLAAGFLILAEAGGGVAALDGSDVWAQPLDLEKRSPFVAWRAGLDGPGLVSRAQKLYSTLLVSP